MSAMELFAQAHFWQALGSQLLLRVTEEPNTADYRDLEISVVDKHNEVLSNTE